MKTPGTIVVLALSLLCFSSIANAKQAQDVCRNPSAMLYRSCLVPAAHPKLRRLRVPAPQKQFDPIQLIPLGVKLLGALGGSGGTTVNVNLINLNF